MGGTKAEADVEANQLRSAQMPSEAGGAWQVLKEHGKSMVSVLKAWDAAEAKGACSKADFRRAAQALGALGVCWLWYGVWAHHTVTCSVGVFTGDGLAA